MMMMFGDGESRAAAALGDVLDDDFPPVVVAALAANPMGQPRALALRAFGEGRRLDSEMRAAPALSLSGVFLFGKWWHDAVSALFV